MLYFTVMVVNWLLIFESNTPI